MGSCTKGRSNTFNGDIPLDLRKGKRKMKVKDIIKLIEDEEIKPMTHWKIGLMLMEEENEK